MNIEPLGVITRKLFDYCCENDWAGYDPYDALNSEIFKRLPFLDFKLPRLVLTQFLKRNPLNFRPLIMIPKTQNPKAIALFLTAAIKLEIIRNQEETIDSMIERLIALRSPDTSYWCWGYSFPWQSRTILVPRSAPNLVCTVFVTNALLDAYERKQNIRYLDMATSAAKYILDELYWEGNDSVASFSYPQPFIRACVHNANFLGAALFCRIYKHSGEKKYLEPALRAARYSARMQHEDGSWDYGELPTQSWIDNFHTGYNIGALRTICRYLDTTEFEPYIHRGFDFYKKHFFREDDAPKYYHDRTYPIDIHSVAQSIITLIEHSDLDQSNIKLAHNVFEWAVTNMWDERDYFYYQITRYYKNKISYMRWSQAWMLLALATLLEYTQQSSNL